MAVGDKTKMVGGVIHCSPRKMTYAASDIYGTVFQRSPIFEGDHGVRSQFAFMNQGDVIKLHKHRKWVQVAVLEGALHVDQEGAEPFTAVAGDVYFLDPGHPHTETAVEDSLVLVTQGEDRPGWTDD